MLFIEYKTTNYLFDISFLNFELPYISQCFVLHFVRKQNIFPQICIVLLQNFSNNNVLYSTHWKYYDIELLFQVVCQEKNA